MILITGYKGFVGGTLFKFLKSKGIEVVGYDWGETLNLDNISQVIHLGAITSTIEKDVDKILNQNYDFSISLLEQCIHKKINFQYASSASVYGLLKEFKEDSPVDPRTPYAWSKYLFERYANKKIKQGLDIQVQGFRYFNVWGEKGEDHKSQPSPYTKFKAQALKNNCIEIFEGSSNFKRDFINVNNIVMLHFKFLKIPLSGVWNFGTGNVKSFQEIAEEVAKKFNSDIKYIPVPDNLKDSYQGFTCADMSKTNKDLLTYEKDFNYGSAWIR